MEKLFTVRCTNSTSTHWLLDHLAVLLLETAEESRAQTCTGSSMTCKRCLASPYWRHRQMTHAMTYTVTWWAWDLRHCLIIVCYLHEDISTYSMFHVDHTIVGILTSLRQAFHWLFLFLNHHLFCCYSYWYTLTCLFRRLDSESTLCVLVHHLEVNKQVE